MIKDDLQKLIAISVEDGTFTEQELTQLVEVSSLISPLSDHAKRFIALTIFFELRKSLGKDASDILIHKMRLLLDALSDETENTK